MILPGPGATPGGAGSARPRRWPPLLTGFVIGWVTGVATLLILAGMSVHLASQGSLSNQDTDVRLGINIHYLGDVVHRRIVADPPAIAGNITTRDLRLALVPQAGMILTPTFDVAGFFQVSPSVDNQLLVRDGKLAMTMLGQPRLGDLPLPLDLLPFDLAGEMRRAVDKITNMVLLSELNDNLKAGFGDDTFNVTEVGTAGDYLMITLQRK